MLGQANQGTEPMTIKFNKFQVTDGTNKARVFYSLDNRHDGQKVVTLYAKDYMHALRPIFGAETENNSDYQTDYVETDTVRIFENSPLYAAARARAKQNLRDRATKAAARLARHVST
jgi:hypothetical protein